MQGVVVPVQWWYCVRCLVPATYQIHLAKGYYYFQLEVFSGYLCMIKSSEHPSLTREHSIILEWAHSNVI